MVNPAEKGGISANKSISQPHTGRQPDIENWASIYALKLLGMISTAAHITPPALANTPASDFKARTKLTAFAQKKHVTL